MANPEPLRGEIWDVQLPGIGLHPALVLSVNALNSRLGHVAVIPITGTRGPDATHIPLDADAGLTRYDECYADITGLRPVARSSCRKRRGLMHRSELAHIEGQLRTYLGV
jgi:mRNA interferase MazF